MRLSGKMRFKWPLDIARLNALLESCSNLEPSGRPQQFLRCLKDSNNFVGN
jgi:hypothetical protein